MVLSWMLDFLAKTDTVPYFFLTSIFSNLELLETEKALKCDSTSTIILFHYFSEKYILCTMMSQLQSKFLNSKTYPLQKSKPYVHENKF